MTTSRIGHLALGRHHVYASLGGSITHFPTDGSYSKSSFNIGRILSQVNNCDHSTATVTSLYADVNRSALWVGASSGHVMVFTESLQSNDVIIPTVILHRHTGPVYNIQQCKDPSEDDDVIICCGNGLRPIADDWVIDGSDKGTHRTRIERSPSVITNSTYVTIWSADVPTYARSLRTAIQKREEL
uniref:Uncharacterized protein n=1 Tax=Ciona savignyi TaxID=51511 RepID=H2Z0R9_CIOSA